MMTSIRNYMDNLMAELDASVDEPMDNNLEIKTRYYLLEYSGDYLDCVDLLDIHQDKQLFDKE